jgi:hypothetical protein
MLHHKQCKKDKCGVLCFSPQWIQKMDVSVLFEPTISWDFLQHVHGDNKELSNLPLLLTVNTS